MSGIRALMVFKDGRTRERVIQEAKSHHFEIDIERLPLSNPSLSLMPQPASLLREPARAREFKLVSKPIDFAFYEEV